MTRAVVRRRWRLARLGRSGWLAALMLALAACSSPAPLPTKYVLGAPPDAAAASLAQTGLPVVEVKLVRMPDYLDTTDLLVRSGGEIVASGKARWGERLSLGVTRALVLALAARVPDMAVIMAPSVERPARQVLVDITAFESRSDRQVVFAGRWTITDGAGRSVVATEETSLVEAAAGPGDAAVVAAMTRVVEQLADQLARAVERSRPRAPPA